MANAQAFAIGGGAAFGMKIIVIIVPYITWNHFNIC
jgi:hypothetical protein